MLGDQVRKYRKQLGWKQQHLAERIGTTQSVISEIEKGIRSNLSRDLLERLASALAVSVDVLLERPAPAAPDIETPPEELLRAAGYHEDTIRRLIESWPRQPAAFRLEVVTEARQRVDEAQRQEDRIRALLRHTAPII